MGSCSETSALKTVTLKTLRKPITNSQLLSTTEVELIAAPGECKHLKIHSIDLKLKYVLPDFDYTGANPLIFFIDGDGAASPLFKATSVEMNISGDRIYSLTDDVNSFPGRLDENEALVMKTNIAPTEGGSTIVLYITYEVRDVA